MGIFSIFSQREEKQEQTVESQVDDVLLKALLNNDGITREKAMTLPTVSGAVDLISGTIASMPVRLYKVENDRVEEVKNDQRTVLLNGDTGDTLDAYQMKKAMVEDYLMGKGGYCYIRKRRNDVTGLFYVEEHNVEIWKTYEPIEKSYQIMINGKNYKPYEFIKLLRNTKDGASGVGLTVEIAKELETAYQTLTYQLGLVKAGGSKKGFLKSARKLGQEEIDTLKRAWQNLYANNSENIVVLNNGLDFQEASNSSVEMQLNENKKTLHDEINNLFHINKDFDLTFKQAIYPVVKAFETALNRDLLLEREKTNYYFEFDVRETIRASVKERYEAYKIAKDTGFMTINEIRQAENLNYIEGMNVVNVGLGAVLYDAEKMKYFTPNTGETVDLESIEADNVGADESLEIEKRYNKNHDSLGRFSSAGTGSGGGGGSNSPNENIGLSEKTVFDRVSALGKNSLEHKGFKDKQHLNNHWTNGRTHKDEYVKDGIITKEQYEKRAVELAESATDGVNIFGYKTAEGYICRYDIRTNDYVKADLIKGIRTMFKPIDGSDYYFRYEAKEGILHD